MVRISSTYAMGAGGSVPRRHDAYTASLAASTVRPDVRCSEFSLGSSRIRVLTYSGLRGPFYWRASSGARDECNIGPLAYFIPTHVADYPSVLVTSPSVPYMQELPSRARGNKRNPLPSEAPLEVAAIIQTCLRRTASQRPTADQVYRMLLAAPAQMTPDRSPCHVRTLVTKLSALIIVYSWEQQRPAGTIGRIGAAGLGRLSKPYCRAL